MTWCLYYTVVQSDSGCRPVGNQSAISWGAIGNRLAIGRRLYLWCLFLIAESLQLFGDRSATDRRLVGDQSATKNCVGIVCNRCNWSAISRQLVGDQSATCRRPPKAMCDRGLLLLFLIRQWLPTNRQSVGDQLGSDRQPIGDRSATGRRLYLGRLFLIAESLQLFLDRSATDRRLVGDQSATKNCVGIIYNRCNWSAISRQPVGNLSATTNNLSTIDLVAERFHLQQPKPPCDQIVPATVCNRSATSHRPPCNCPATSLRPLKILVARRSPTGCKLCVTGALLVATKTSLRPNRPCNHLQPVGDQSPTSLQPPCNLPATTRNFGRKEVADRLQAMCDRA